MIRWLVVGLGNPGEDYHDSRHNSGFMVVERFQKSLAPSPWSLDKKFNALVNQVGQVLVMKPQTFMNQSGEAVSRAIRFYKIPLDHLIVVHDDLDISFGIIKSAIDKGPKRHNGLASIETQLGSTNFWRVRVGIEGRSAEMRTLISGEKYVLMTFSSDERYALNEVIDQAVLKIQDIIRNEK